MTLGFQRRFSRLNQLLGKKQALTNVAPCMAEIDHTLERTRERVAEHEPHGWLVETPLYTVSNSIKRDGYFMNCSCGWRGWIAEDPENPVRETYQQRF